MFLHNSEALLKFGRAFKKRCLSNLRNSNCSLDGHFVSYVACNAKVSTVVKSVKLAVDASERSVEGLAALIVASSKLALPSLLFVVDVK